MRFVDWFRFEPNTLQKSLLDLLRGCAVPGGAGLLVLMWPTGSGKTEGGLWSAQWMGGPRMGVHLALPSVATTDSAYRRVWRWARRALAASSPVTLAHSQAGRGGQGAMLSHDDDEGLALAAAPEFLQGRGRPVLAGVTVSTIDQVLLAVLRIRHNVLRIGGLTRKVLVVDECHAYDPYMQSLLRTVLAWWGALGVPVVLMSATLPRSVARSLAAAYLSGSAPGVPLPEFCPAYPGWFHVDGATGRPTVRPVDTGRTRILKVRLVGLPGSHLATRRDAVPACDRARARVVAQLFAHGRQQLCVLTVCNTVASAQNTALVLRALLPADVEVLLVHAHYRERDRAGVTANVEQAFGKDRTHRPRRAVLVTTQVCEQALDLDLNHVVTDLAPLPTIIQRAGRGRRHTERSRVRVPVTVLVPLTAEGLPDDGRWEAIYSTAVVRATRELLEGRRVITEPDDVQPLLEALEDRLGDGSSDEDVLSHLEGEQAMADAARPVVIPHPRELVDLFDLTDLSGTDEEAATRYRLDSIQILPLWRRLEGLSLEPDSFLPLPARLPHDLEPVRERLVSTRHATWQKHLGADAQPPAGWAGDKRLGPLVLLVHPAPGKPVHAAGWTVFYDRYLGLVARPPTPKE
ncbi:CRISPR-associated helicase Cas3' [Kitasatospora aureofaciens]|uniref:CRISPR-associated helicase Cas3' n=1 Tax=Kitasatospora aureofaciens TaxID=1894 RepID=UPI001C485FBE|nr:CRISPR-associated helicase Cas3' [Kitasatospora aureofaciens]MBV6695726.1 CRISPR-associated helicase Cas3' [Kitasatospora aureofaciens]